jgi:hypothetical protein
MVALTLRCGASDALDVLDEDDDGVGAAEAEVEAVSLPSELLDLRSLLFLDEDDGL